MGRRARGGLRVRGEAAAAVPQWPGHDPGLPGTGGPGPPGRGQGDGPGRGDRRVHRGPPEFRGPAAADACHGARPAPAGCRPGDLPGLRHHGPGGDAPDPGVLRAAPGHPRRPAAGQRAGARAALVSRRRQGRARGEHPRRPGGRRGQAPGFPLPPRTPFGRVAEDQAPADRGRGRGRHQPGARAPVRADRLAARRCPRAGGPDLCRPGRHRLRPA